MDRVEHRQRYFPSIPFRVRMAVMLGPVALYFLWAMLAPLPAWLQSDGLDRFFTGDNFGNAFFAIGFLAAFVGMVAGAFHGSKLGVRGEFLTLYAGNRKVKFEIARIRSVHAAFYRGTCQLVEVRQSRFELPDRVELQAEDMDEVLALEHACREHGVPFKRVNHILNPRGFVMGLVQPLAGSVVTILLLSWWVRTGLLGL